MRILGKDSYWWKKEEQEWAMQDRDGNWWVYKNDKKRTMETKGKRKGEKSLKFTSEQYVMIGLGAALGVSLALNIVALLS